MTFPSLSSFDIGYDDNRPPVAIAMAEQQLDARFPRTEYWVPTSALGIDEVGASQTDSFFSVVDPAWPADVTRFLLGRATDQQRARLLARISSSEGREHVRMLLTQAARSKASTAYDLAIDLLAEAGGVLYDTVRRHAHSLPDEAWYIILGAIARAKLDLALKENMLASALESDSLDKRDAAVHALGALAYYDSTAAVARHLLSLTAQTDPDPTIRAAAAAQLDDLA